MSIPHANCYSTMIIPCNRPSRELAKKGVVGFHVPVWVLLMLVLAVVMLPDGQAMDPPHTNICSSCHLTHNALGTEITSAAGNGNLCMSCHFTGLNASGKPFSIGAQALPWPGLPAGTNTLGNSHRWDAGAAGHVVFLGGALTNSTGTLLTTGTFTGAYAKTYTVIVTNTGNAGTVRFNWSATSPGGGGASNVLTGTNVVLNEGISVTFINGTGISFQANDKWNIYVRTDIRQPTNAVLVKNLDNGLVVCSTCHDEHSQTNAPFDPLAPAYAGTNTGKGRHFMSMANNTEQMCVDCHAIRNVTNSVSGSHPVGIKGITNAYYKYTTNLPLEKTTANVRCETCHKIHFASANDGDLMRMTNATSVCIECHQLANTATPAAHLAVTNPAVLWPGGQYGTLFPARSNTLDRGSCMNCHAPHGWPVSTNTAAHYPKLLMDLEENLCYTCHDTNGPALKNVKDDFAKVRRHPIGDTDTLRRVGRSVECSDCHNPHQAMSGSYVYTNTATATRNRISNPLKGVEGVAINYTSLTNFQTVPTNLYTVVPKSVGATNEYEICFKCHTSYSFGTTPPPGLTPVYSAGTAAFTNGIATIKGTGTAWNSGMVGMWIVRTNDPANAYKITAVANATNMTITPVYAGTTASGQGYALTLGTDIAMEFSPMNKSGHPIVTGLDNYPNSLVIAGKKGLLAAALKTPWNVNIGQQTMMCSDCHNTDGASTAAQGPHGSAAQFMLRGANAANWPNITLANFNTSWCANCHNNAAGTTHTRGDHTGRQCYQCHIVIPHGGKLSRLIADNDTMPARYAYNGTRNTSYMQSFTKAATGSYSESNCRAQCAGEHSGRTPSENW